MTPALDALLSDWKSKQTDAKELRTVTILPGKSNPAEFEIILKMSVRVIDMAIRNSLGIKKDSNPGSVYRSGYNRPDCIEGKHRSAQS